MRRLQPTFQSYDWGKVGAASMVARLTSAGSSGGINILETQPFAELWMGTHPSGPSTLIGGGGDSKDSPDETLQAYLMRDSSALGVDPYSLTTGALPYLFKVLSIEKALSVQAHPDSALAKKLYAERPKVYKDPNHKPEMACALTPFEAMCSFRPPSEIASIIRRVPELVTLLGGEEKAEVLARTADSVTPSSSNETMDIFSRELKAAYSTLMTQPAEIVSAAVSLLKTRLEEEVVERVNHLGTISQDSRSMENTDPFAKLSPDACALRLCSQFPGDVGVFSPFLLNVVTLEPGDAIFLGANEPHAYLSGDCVEIMACSDNVVRAGLTPKFKDVSILCEMLTYKCGRPEILKGTTFQSEGACIAREYTAPVPEFMLQQFSIPAGESKSLSMPPARSAALLIVICGSGTVESSTEQGEVCCSISEGQVWLQHAGTQMKLSSTNADKDLLIFRSAVAR